MSAAPEPQVVGLLADVHGNTWALDAVLADLDRRGIRSILDLGDLVYGPLDPTGTIERLRGRNIHHLSGNQDRVIAAPPPAVRASPGWAYVVGQLGEEDRRWIAELPASARIGDVLGCHGTPASDETYLLEEVTAHGVHLRPVSAIAADLPATAATVIACGHSHVPRTVRLDDGRLVVNPGSVGLPAYTHDLPHPHAMEAGSPHARYAVLRREGREGETWAVEHVALPYRWWEAAAAARRNGRPDWAVWLETGRAGPG